MAKFPKLDIILAGFLAQISLRLVIYIQEMDDEQYHSRTVTLCKNDRILWLTLILMSVGVAIITTWRNKEDKYTQGTITFVVSFLLNFAGDNLGHLAAACTANNYGLDNFNRIYSGISLAIMIIACIGILVYLRKTLSTPRANRILDPDILLLGLCAHYAFWHSVTFQGRGNKSEYGLYCKNKGLRSWIQLVASSAILALITSGRGVASAIVTFLATFQLNLVVGATGKLAIFCAIEDSSQNLRFFMEWITKVYHENFLKRIYMNFSMVSLGLLAVGITVWSCKKTYDTLSGQPAIEPQAATEDPVQTGIPVQDTKVV